MTTSRFLPSLVVALALTGCGSDESHKTTPPAAPPPAAVNKPAAAPPVGPPPSACIGKWTTGTTGTLTCSAPGKNATFDKASFRLDRVCVNDPRVTTYTAGGKTVTMTLKPDGKQHCASFNGVAEVPESCSCVAPSGGDCNPPSDGFICLAIGHSAPAGG
jgi:hypothetical protein